MDKAAPWPSQHLPLLIPFSLVSQICSRHRRRRRRYSQPPPPPVPHSCWSRALPSPNIFILHALLFTACCWCLAPTKAENNGTTAMRLAAKGSMDVCMSRAAPSCSWLAAGTGVYDAHDGGRQWCVLGKQIACSNVRQMQNLKPVATEANLAASTCTGNLECIACCSN